MIETWKTCIRFAFSYIKLPTRACFWVSSFEQ